MLNEALQIDPSMLDEEWLQQLLLFDQAASYAADCQAEVDQLKNTKTENKEKLEWLEADRSNYLRAAFNEEGFTKPPTVDAVKDWVTKRPEVEAAKEDLHRIQRELSEAENVLLRANNTVKAFETRKASLENLCKLHGMNYFSIPNPGHMLDGGKRVLEAKAQKVEQTSAEATEKLNERKKARTTRDGKTKDEVLDSIKNPDTREAARTAIEAEEQKEETQEEVKPRARRRRR